MTGLDFREINYTVYCENVIRGERAVDCVLWPPLSHLDSCGHQYAIPQVEGVDMLFFGGFSAFDDSRIIV